MSVLPLILVKHIVWARVMQCSVFEQKAEYYHGSVGLAILALQLLAIQKFVTAVQRSITPPLAVGRVCKDFDFDCSFVA